MASVTLKQASIIADATIEKGRQMKFEPLTVVVLDAGGHIVAAKRDDGSGILRIEIATGKAYGALGFGFGSRELFERSKGPQTVFMTAMSAIAGGKFTPLPSGVLLRDAENRVIGAVGVSGDNSDNDEIAALAGIAAAGLKGQVGKAVA